MTSLSAMVGDNRHHHDADGPRSFCSFVSSCEDAVQLKCHNYKCTFLFAVSIFWELFSLFFFSSNIQKRGLLSLTMAASGVYIF